MVKIILKLYYHFYKTIDRNITPYEQAASDKEILGARA